MSSIRCREELAPHANSAPSAPVWGWRAYHKIMPHLSWGQLRLRQGLRHTQFVLDGIPGHRSARTSREVVTKGGRKANLRLSCGAGYHSGPLVLSPASNSAELMPLSIVHLGHGRGKYFSTGFYGLLVRGAPGMKHAHSSRWVFV